MNINLTDRTLFGNDVAEDEDETLFFSYAIRKAEITQFTSDSKLLIATGMKGEGKSALLRLAERDFKDRRKAITISAKSSSIAPKLSSTDQDEWVEAWKESICISIAETIGENIGFTTSSDKDTLKRIAVESGAKSQNIISRMITGIKLKASTEVSGIGAGVEVSVPPPSSPKNLNAVIRRVLSEEDEIYILLDDIDHNFENTKLHKAKIAGLLTASRYLTNETPQLKFRLTLRDNVWTIIGKEYASMSHISQYIVNLKWTESELNDMLAQRIRSYISRSNLGDIQHISNKNDVVRLVFLNGEWGNEPDIDAIRPLATFSQRRPRWFLELCKLSASNASTRFQKAITFENITAVSEEYGRKILNDMSVEYECEQKQVASYFTAFMGQVSKFKYIELITTIKNRIVEGMPEPKQTALEVAHFLFYMGFISAREASGENHYKHYSYADQPNFLTKGYPGNEKVDWEVQAIFRGCLKLNTPGKMKPGSKHSLRK